MAYKGSNDLYYYNIESIKNIYLVSGFSAPIE